MPSRTPTRTPVDFLQSARRTIRIEADAVNALAGTVGSTFVRACELLLACKGRVIVTGMGKSGHIARKLAATLASTGSPAFFVHPGEASHGDMGMITLEDVVIALSNSGNTAEILTLLPLIKRLGIPLISLTGSAQSILAREATVNVDVSVQSEACPLNLAPTSSTTVALVMGDALAIALLEARGFTAEDFAFSHPGGTLGRKLLLKVADIMHTGAQIPRVAPDTVLADALLEITQKGLGMTTVQSANGQLDGVFTDGDLRRALGNNVDIHRTRIGELTGKRCLSVSPSMLAAEALAIMEEKSVTALVVVEDNPSNSLPALVGVVHLHDLLKSGVA